MKIIDLGFDNFYTLSLTVNLFAVLIAAIVCYILSALVRYMVRKTNSKSIVIDEVKLGIGKSEVVMHYDQRDREIAYKIWVELTTRKIGILFDEKDDVICEVYSSWYKCFETIRDLLKQIPAEHLKNSTNLITVTSSVLNYGLRPHLTKWQARFRYWYENESDKTKAPQIRQKEYPQYEELVKELRESNEKIIAFTEKLKEIAFGEI